MHWIHPPPIFGLVDGHLLVHSGEVNVYLGLRNRYKWSSIASGSITSIQLTFDGLPG